MSKDEGLQHLFVLAIAAFLIVSPIFLVKPANLEYSLIGLGILFGVIDIIVAVALRRPVS